MSFTGDQPLWRTGLLLERERETAALESLLAELSGPSQEPAATGTGGLLVFAGPAGLGKTTLLNEVRRRALARGCTVLSARGGEQEQGVAFQVVRHLLQPLLATGTEEEHREALGNWYDIVAPAVGLVAAPNGSPDPQGVRDGLDWIVTRFAVQRAPLVVMLDDAHWADAESLAWLTGFAPRVNELPMLLVVAYRPDELPRAAETFGRLAVRHGSRPLDLAPLTPGAVSRIVRDILGEDADEAFCRETWAVTGGNPFEAVELAARFADRGLKPQVVHLPELRELASAVKGGGLVAQLERLGTSAVRFAWSVAVLGAGASRRRAASVGGLGEAESADAVSRLREARILAEPPRDGHEAADGRLEFFHPLVSTAVYQAIPAAFRVAMHGQAAAVVAQAGLGSTAAARHLLETHPESDPWVVQQLCAAAREYQRAGAPDAARRCLARALREPPAMEDRAQVLFELGCSALLTEPAITVNHLRAALDEPVLTPDLREAIVYRLAQALGHSDRMAEAAQTVAEAARSATDVKTRLHLQAEQFMWNAFRADEQDSTARSRKLARLADHLPGRGAAERYILGLRAWDAMVRGEPAATALHWADQALAGGLPWTDELWGFEVPVLVALTFMYCDQPGRAEQLFHQGIAECQDKGWRGAHLSFGYTLLGYIRFRRGRLSSAETMVRDGLRIADRVGQQVPAQYFALGILIEILLARGRVEEAQELALSYGYGDITPSAVVYPDAQTVHSELLLALGRHREAEEQLTRVGARLDARGMRNPAWCPWPLRLALATEATDPERAVAVAEEGVARARRFGTQSAVGQALHALAAVTPMPRRAALLAEAVGHLERSPSGYDLARALVDHGVALRRTGLPQQAAEQLHRGLEGAALSGADGLAARAREELDATGLWPLQPRVADADALTVQERAVAEWAAAGRSVAQMAEALGTSEVTVTRLLSDIYLKAGCDYTGLPRLIAGTDSKTP
ncbi:regulatory protein, luxR family [Streptomyces sp. DvalAA-14]|uniref:ATP-binding protein n=1 Tax=unclassified Streptomyces TaxID=2593676 RepID=UPI00081BB47B|nr:MULTISPECIES: AAA family ATPase [unclassified Streptomyces]MYS19740.1 AAA family ATPase [Streptomyces sp. SID4948]SCD52061.1 regulatory protein, luxR family [Streptomyces sp. DvalAA-14]